MCAYRIFSYKTHGYYFSIGSSTAGFLEIAKFHLHKSVPGQGLLNRWTSQLDLGCTSGGLERVVSVHNFGAP